MLSNIRTLVEKDIWSWIVNYIEVENKFYDYKFPVCPFARTARLKGLVSVVGYESGNIKTFIKQNVYKVVDDPVHDICVIAMPPRAQFTWGISALVEQLNKEVIPKGYYVQYGTAVKTKSLYPGLFNNGRYFAVFVNKLGPVLDAHNGLLRTEYYKPWSKEHYDAVVVRRQELYEKYSNPQNKVEFK